MRKCISPCLKKKKKTDSAAYFSSPWATSFAIFFLFAFSLFFLFNDAAPVVGFGWWKYGVGFIFFFFFLHGEMHLRIPPPRR